MIWLGFLALALAIAVYGAGQALRARFALTWPHVQGVIVQCGVRQVSEDPDRFERDFSYAYKVNGRDYTGDRVELWGDLRRSATSSWLSTPIQRFAAGQAVKVFYNPLHPASAIVSKSALPAARLPAALFWSLLLGVGLFLVAAVPSKLHDKMQAPDLSHILPHLTLETLAPGLLALSATWLVWRLLLPLRMAALFRRVPATVLVSRVQYFREHDRSSHVTEARYRPHVEYEYEVGGTVYQDQRLAWDADAITGSREKTAQRRQVQYRVGEQIEVHVHRLDAATSVVDGRFDVLHLAVPGLFILVLGGLTWLAQFNAAAKVLPASRAQVFQTAEAASAAADTATQLDLSGQGLGELPESVRKLKKLQHLDLHDNQLATLPAWLGELRELRVVILHHNRLKAVPKSLCSAPQLRELDVSHNVLSDTGTDWWHQELRHAPRLEKVLAAHNRLEANAAEALLTAMPLVEIDLSHNLLELETVHLARIEEKAIDMRRLKRLDLRGNPKLRSAAVDQLQALWPAVEVQRDEAKRRDSRRAH